MKSLEGIFRGHLVQLPCNKQGYLQLDQVARSNLTLNVFTDGDSTTPLGNLLQCLTTITTKNFVPLYRSAYILQSFCDTRAQLLKISSESPEQELKSCSTITQKPSLINSPIIFRTAHPSRAIKGRCTHC